VSKIYGNKNEKGFEALHSVNLSIKKENSYAF
jgi:ABC-type lipoprotein export system ATPase subunit